MIMSESPAQSDSGYIIVIIPKRLVFWAPVSAPRRLFKTPG